LFISVLEEALVDGLPKFNVHKIVLRVVVIDTHFGSARSLALIVNDTIVLLLKALSVPEATLSIW